MVPDTRSCPFTGLLVYAAGSVQEHALFTASRGGEQRARWFGGPT